MTAELTQLAQTAATTLVAAATTSTWGAARDGFSRLFGRGGGNELAERRLDETSTEINKASGVERDRLRADLTRTWQTRLADLLDERPEMADEMVALVGALKTSLPAPHYSQHVEARDNSTVFVTFGENASTNILGRLTGER